MKALEKYQRLFLQQHTQRLQDWLTGDDTVTEREIYRFLHTIKGTAPQIDLENWAAIAEKLEQKVDEDKDVAWSKNQLYTFLQPLISLIDLSNEEGESRDSEADMFLFRKKEQGDKPLIFLIDDDIVLLQFLKEQLELEGFIVLLATSYKDQTIQHFYRWKPDCILMDVHMPEKDGFDILAILKKQAAAYHVPIIMMSGDGSKEQRLKAFQAADDFISKPIDLEELTIRLKQFTSKRKEFLEFVLVDPLTGAVNEKYAKKEIQRQLEQLRGIQESFCLALIDIDGFQSLNDRYGYSVGDRILQELTKYTAKQVRAFDIVARFGSNQFLIIFPHMAQHKAKAIIEKILQGFPAVVQKLVNDSLMTSLSASLIEIKNPELSPKECIAKLASPYYGKAFRETGKLTLVHSMKEERKRIVRIAVIDDDPIIRGILETQLRDLGSSEFDIEIRTYENGELFFQDPWHETYKQYFVIVDGVMPRMDGLEVIQRLRQQFDERAYTIMMLTNRRSEQDVATAIQKGANDYLKKPFGIEELQARVKRLIRGRS